MSLIVARQVGDSIFLISDTKITSPNDDRLSSTIDEHLLKVVILSPQIVYAFAGNVDDAEEVLKKISLQTSLFEIESSVYEAHMSSMRDGEYRLECILAIGKPDFALIEFKNGIQKKVSNSWIGCKDGFELFQKYYHEGVSKEENHEENKTSNLYPKHPSIITSMNFSISQEPSNVEKQSPFLDKYSKATTAMKGVIESSAIKEVGGFYIPVAYHEGEFSYMHYSSIFSAEQIIPLTKSVTSSIISFGTPEAGAYIVSLHQLQIENKKIVLLHFAHGELGIIYERASYGLPRPFLYPHQDAIDFSFAVKNKFQLFDPPAFSISFSIDNLGINLNKCFKNGNLVTSLERVNWGIEKYQKDKSIWKLYLFRANLFMKLRNYKGAINDFDIILPFVPSSSLEEINNSKGLAFAYLNKFEHAINNFSETLKINPSRATTYFNRSLCLFNIANIKKSKVGLKNAKADLHEAEKLGYNKNQITGLKQNIESLEKNL